MSVVWWVIALGAAASAAWWVAVRMPWPDPELRALAGTTTVLGQLVAVVFSDGFVLRVVRPWSTAVTGVVLAAGIVAVARGRGGRVARRGHVARPADLGRVRWAGAAVWALATGATALAALLPPRGFDTLWYHLPSVGHWLGEGRITTASFTPIIGRYPADVELLWLHAATFARSARVLVFVNLALLLQLFVATRALGRTLGLSRRAALGAATIIAATPVVLAQTVTGHVDAATTAFVVTAAAFAAALLDRARPVGAGSVLAHGALLGVAVGLAAGSKMSAVAPSLLLAAAAVWWSGHGRPGVRLRLLGAVALGAAVLGAPWYVRNLVADGNPVAPFAVRAGGVTIFDGPADSEEWLSEPPAWIEGRPRPVQLAQAVAYDAVLPVAPHTIQEEEPRGGFGVWWPFAGLPSCGVVLVRTLRRLRRDGVRPAVGAVVPVLYLVTSALAQPYWWWTRFLLPVAVLGALAIPVAARGLARRVRQVGVVALTASVAFGALLGVGHVGYPEEQWSGHLPAALRLVAREGPLVPYGPVMPSRAVFDDLGPGVVGVDDAINRGGEVYPVLVFPLYGVGFDRRVLGVPVGSDAASLDAWIEQHRPLAIAASPGGTLEALLRADPAFTEVTPAPVRLSVFVRAGR